MKTKFFTALLSMIVIGLMVGAAGAQDNVLPDKPIMEGIIFRDKIAWSADGKTLLFQMVDYSADHEPDKAYQYDPATGKLSELDTMPFTLTLNDEQKAYFQARDNTIPKSPYHNAILYTSTLSVVCGGECDGTLIMQGTYCYAPDCVELWGFYEPLNLISQGDFRVVWSRGGAAVLIRDTNYGSFHELIYSGAEGTYVIADTFDRDDNDVFDLSNDGKRVLYENPESGSKLMLWEIESFDSEKTHLVTTDQQKIMDGHVTGAGFSTSNSDYLFYLDDEGIKQYEISGGRSELLNPAINATWVQFGLFSPDNRYIAVLSDNKLYVVPTGIEDR